MWRNPKNKDEQIQDYISRQVREWNHAHGLKKALNKAAGAIAAALARLFIRDRNTAQISYLSGGCFPHMVSCAVSVVQTVPVLPLMRHAQHTTHLWAAGACVRILRGGGTPVTL